MHLSQTESSLLRWFPLCLATIAGVFPAAVYAQDIEAIEQDQGQFEQVGRRSDDDHPVIASRDTEALRQGAALIVEKTNAFRERNGLEPVESDAQLTDAALYFAQYMGRTGRYGHRADGQRPAQRASSHGYDYCIVAENIAYAFRSTGFEPGELAEKFVQGWIESKGHRENMLMDGVSDLGVAIAQDEQTDYYFAVQMFGRPRSEAVEFTVANRTTDDVKYVVAYDDQRRSFTLPPRAAMTHTRCRPPQIWLATADQRRIEVAANDRYAVRSERNQPVLLEESSSPTSSPE